MADHKHSPANGETVSAGVLRPWTVDELPEPPKMDWRQARGMVGPGLLLAGASVGAGEWLFGPAVTAQYGTTFLWIATVSILCQLFLNLEVMRYALYCGEPVVVGYFRTRPGPWFWTFFYLLMETPLIWPYMASNAAVPLRFGSIAFETVIQDRHFTLTERGPTTFSIRGTVADGQPVVTSFTAGGDTYALGQPMPAELEGEMRRLLDTALALAQPKRFYVRQAGDAQSITVSGDI